MLNWCKLIGCTVVIKPAEETPLSALALCVIAEEAGLPKGIMNCLTVARSEVTKVSQATFLYIYILYILALF